MPIYDAKRFLTRALLSCLRQTYKNIEIVCVDDGSNDGSAELVKELMYDDARIKLYTTNHRGCPAALNIALSKAEGEYIARLDADDWYHPTKIEKQMAVIEENMIVSTDMFMVTPQSMKAVRGRKLVAEHYMVDSKEGGPVCASILTSKTVFAKVGLFDEELIVSEDRDWNMRSVLAGVKWGHIQECLYYYRMHDTQQQITHQEHLMSCKRRVIQRYAKQWSEQ